MATEQTSLHLFSDERRSITGEPLRIVYQNSDSGYTVMIVHVVESEEDVRERELSIIGYFPTVHLNELYQFYGELKTHPRYGLQYEVDHYRKLLPQSETGIIQYLSGKLFPGIGKKTAQMIVHTLGAEAISKILSNPACLKAVPHLEEDKAKQIVATLQENEGLESILIGLADLGFGAQLATRIYQLYGDETLEVIHDSPYQLIQDIDGIGFQRADELARMLGMSPRDSARIQAAVLFWLDERALNDGHVYMSVADTCEAVRQLLVASVPEAPVSAADINHELLVLEEEGKLIVESEEAYLPPLFYAEKGIVTSIQKLTESAAGAPEFSESEFFGAVGSVEERLHMQYAERQQQAIRTAIQEPAMILTGGPGTGKTTVVRGLVEVYAEMNGFSLDTKDYDSEHPYPVLLVAPTGRAAKRLNEATGIPAVTIHRLLGWSGGANYAHDEDTPIEGRLLIVDEMSMVDIWLANQLFKSMPAGMKLVLVGDEDQLPSVGPGQVLADLIGSQVLPLVRLTAIFRQAQGSSIVELAHAIKSGSAGDVTEPKPDRRFICCEQSQIVTAVCQIASAAEKKGFVPRDIQVLAPIYRGNAGIEKLNEALQQLFNPPSQQKRSCTVGDRTFRVHDKVLQLVNNPDNHVFNGDIGEIVAILTAKETVDKEDTMVVSFDNEIEVSYLRSDFNQLTLAYCCSIHKAQGSEFPIVILPVVKGYHRMLRRNLIYTAITRSKKFLMLCGDPQAFIQAIAQHDADSRHSNLARKLRERLHLQEAAPPDQVL
ncbi:MAG: ATP-dependent RecD-like DNA helicase [Sporolactobacillus sp.]